VKQENIRNFCIIAHVDHGKSTLADRLLEKTGTIPPREMRAQVLDNMELEREKGVTIKLKAVRMNYDLAGQKFILNLIDTPGHVDFSYEVSRALAACEGAVLVIDATQGIQAQTIANLQKAKDQNLKIIPVINKIDLPNAIPLEIEQQVVEVFGFEKSEIIFASGKTGEGVEEIIKAIVERVPAPNGNYENPLRGLVFDSSYNEHLGVVAYVRVVDGKISENEKILFMRTGATCEPKEVGYLFPDFKKGEGVETGAVGYIATGLKDISLVRVGDTVTSISVAAGPASPRGAFTPAVSALPGYKEPKQVVFESFYPDDGSDFDKLKVALSKLKLEDASLSIFPESSIALGRGFRLGFLGMFHAEIIKERILREFEIPVIVTLPTVAYEVQKTSGETFTLETASELPDASEIKEVREPWVTATVFTPINFLGQVMTLCQNSRGILLSQIMANEKMIQLTYKLPLSELIFNFYDSLKSVTSGYASLDYALSDYAPIDVVKLDVLLHGEVIPNLSRIVLRSEAQKIGQNLVIKIKEVLPKQQFAVAIQTAVGGKIIARETLSALRKDVLAKLSGGHQERKMKVLKRQKKGKAEMARFGRVTLPPEAFKKLV